jgi:hypothetical protein
MREHGTEKQTRPVQLRPEHLPNTKGKKKKKTQEPTTWPMVTQACDPSTMAG